MKYLPLIAAFAVLAVAAPAAAVVTTFSTFSAVGGTNVRYVNSGTSAGRTTDATYFTTTTPGATSAGAVLVNFSFINSLLAPSVTNISASYTLNAVVAKNTPALVLGSSYIQPGLSGTFSFLTTSDMTITGPGLVTTFYAAGSNLLSGTFNSGSIIASRLGTSGASFASGVSGTNITFTSDFLTFAAGAFLDRSTALTAIAPASFLGANGALRTFCAVSGGQFSADPNPIPSATSAVPEPASWAMLIGGFSLVGVSMRRRKRAVAA